MRNGWTDDKQIEVPEDKLLLTIPEARQLLGISRAYLYELIKFEGLPAITLRSNKRGRWFIPREGLIKWLQTRKLVR